MSARPGLRSPRPPVEWACPDAGPAGRRRARAGRVRRRGAMVPRGEVGDACGRLQYSARARVTQGSRGTGAPGRDGRYSCRMTSRGRIAPTPTGDMHLGHARTYLAAWRRAREANGAMIL